MSALAVNTQNSHKNFKKIYETMSICLFGGAERRLETYFETETSRNSARDPVDCAIHIDGFNINVEQTIKLQMQQPQTFF
ncbi:hypothetical protein L596_012827 [Steinernema carpocapsae]|uniref:Uncharacterized protein n=1 Tax=Steinernema carpocapsae TaxID=34508 RepID=A0A4V6A4X2_STECR|nr:hypothetical protein L596_012827 [Steinernema carpocapsae]